MDRLLRTALWLALVTISVAAGCSGGDGNDPVVARVGHVSITMSELQSRLNELPPYTKAQYATPEGQIEFLDRLVEEEVLYQASENAGYETAPSVTIPVEALKRRAMIQAYYRDKIEKETEVPEEDIVAYYDEYSEKFARPARVRFRHIMADTRAQALEARRRVMAGETFALVAKELTTDDKTRDAGGLLKSVSLGKGVPRLGMSSAFIESLFEWKSGEVTEPMRSDDGWHVIKIEEITEAGTKPLEEVRQDITQTLMPGAVRKKYDEVYEDLKSRYNATINEDVIRPKFRTEQEIFDLASDTEDPLKRLSLYRELIFSYPEGEHAAEAQFMLAFIYAEELQDYEAAEFEFMKMLDKYPDSKLAESAEWMLENMRSEDPEFSDMEPAATE